MKILKQEEIMAGLLGHLGNDYEITYDNTKSHKKLEKEIKQLIKQNKRGKISLKETVKKIMDLI